MTQLTDRLRDLALTSKHLCQSPDCTEPQCIAEQAANELESLRAERDTAEANLARLQDRWDARPATEELEARLAEAERQRDGLIGIIRGVHGRLLDDRIATVVRTPDSASVAQEIKA